MTCEMCGSEGNTVTAMVEGVELRVCQKCSPFGKIVAKQRLFRKIEVKPKEKGKEIVEVIIPNYYVLIREKREKMRTLCPSRRASER